MPNVYQISGDGTVVLSGGDPDGTSSSVLWANGPTYPDDPPTPWDLLPEEEKQPVHPWTLEWWRLLPACHRYLDPLQGSRESESWHGLNADPRWILSWDGWETYNRSTSPDRATVEFRRIFRSVPGRPIYIQTWGNPQGHTIDVTIRVADSSGLPFGGFSEQIGGTEQQMIGALVDKPRNGILVVSVIVDLDAFSERLALDAIHVGDRFVSDFVDLPDYADKKTPAAYPLLRWMDGPGRVAGEVSDIVANLIDGVYTDPRRAPDEALRWLAMMLGFPVAQIPADVGTLREHLIHFVDHGRPKVGSREAIQEVASRWLTGTRSAKVVPQRLYGSLQSQEEKDLLTATGRTGDVLVAGEPPVPDREYRWEGAAHGSRSIRLSRGVVDAENLVPNPSFETGVAGWRPSTYAELAHDLTRFRSGTASAAAYFRLGGSSIETDLITVAGGGESTFRVLVYAEKPATMRLYLRDEAGTALRVSSAHEVEANKWQIIEGSWRFTADTPVRLAVYSSTTDVRAWIDSAYGARAALDAGTYFDGSLADSAFSDVWVDSNTDPAAPDVRLWETPTGAANNSWVSSTDPAVINAGAAVLTNQGGITREKAHTLVLLARPDEVPNGDLVAFAQFVQSQDVVPAGHKLIAQNPVKSWDVHEAAIGNTWNEVERAKTWNDQESAGLLEN